MMVSFQGYNGRNKSHGVYRDQQSNEVANNVINGGGSSNSTDGKGLVTVTKLSTITDLAAQKHALSERKRRKQINAHYVSLRKFFPRLLKNDKASVLTETVHCLKELKRIIAEVAPSQNDDEWGSGKKSRQSFIPSENDKATVLSYCDGGKETVKAIVCCEDRLNLNQDLTEAIQSVGRKIVKAKMVMVGGRTKMELVVEWSEYDSKGEENLAPLRRALKAVVEN